MKKIDFDRQKFTLILVCSAFLFLNASIAAQDDEISLPDVTTVISGESLESTEDSVPDYREILSETSSTTLSLPVLDDVKKTEIPAVTSGENSEKNKAVYAQGEIGGGYPLCFDADLSVYKTGGNFPFELNFSHEGVEGFSGKKAEKGFFGRETAVSARADYFGEIGEHSFSASYETEDDGLQSKSDAYTDIVKHDAKTSYDVKWFLPKGFYLSYGASGEWYRRYGQRFSGGVRYKNCEAVVSTLSAEPFLKFGWAGAYGLDFNLSGIYGYQGSLETAKQLEKIEGSWHRHYSHRAQFTLGASWHNSFLNIGADGSAIIGTATGKKDVIPSFTLKTELRTAFFDFGDFVFSARGGLDSYQEKISTLERKYRFSYAACIPLETTDWFACGKISLPLSSIFVVSGEAEFRKTAFGNGIWTVDYDKSNYRSSGLYAIINSDGESLTEERTDFSPGAEINAAFSIVKILAGWKSHWKDVPSLSERHSLYAKASLQSDASKLGGGVSAKVSFGDDSDKCPDLGVWAEYEIIPAVSVAVKVDDAVKLVQQKTRKYADSDYIEKAGTAKLLVKFQI